MDVNGVLSTCSWRPHYNPLSNMKAGQSTGFSNSIWIRHFPAVFDSRLEFTIKIYTPLKKHHEPSMSHPFSIIHRRIHRRLRQVQPNPSLLDSEKSGKDVDHVTDVDPELGENKVPRCVVFAPWGAGGEWFFVWCGMVWYGMVWYGMVWYSDVQYSTVKEQFITLQYSIV